MNILDTGVKTIKNVSNVEFGKNSLTNINQIIGNKLPSKCSLKSVIVFIDHFFINDCITDIFNEYSIVYVDSTEEPKTTYIDEIMHELKSELNIKPEIIVGFGGGTTLDTAKACSNLFNNLGLASEYQGWDKLSNPGVYKIGIPTISGTGAEATRTCVMTNPENGLKLGMNSDYTVFDYIILDSTLTKTVERNQYFFTGMDAYIHCMEAIEGQYRNPIGDAFSSETLKICRDVFLSDDMMSDLNRDKLMVASYLGGCSIATSYVGIVHPFSAGLSVVLGIHHCEANCIVMNAMEEFYPLYFKEFNKMSQIQKVVIRKGIASNLTQEQYEQLYEATIIHEKPLYNALGKKFKQILNKEKVIEIFKKM